MDEIARCGVQTAKAEDAGLDYEEITDLPATIHVLEEKGPGGDRKPLDRKVGQHTIHGWMSDDEALFQNAEQDKGHAHMNRHQNLMDSTAAARTDEDVEVTSPRCTVDSTTRARKHRTTWYWSAKRWRKTGIDISETTLDHYNDGDQNIMMEDIWNRPLNRKL